MTDEVKKPQVTTAAEWRQPYDEGVEYVLPSGNVALLRPPSVDHLMEELGHLPDTLSAVAFDTLTSEKTMEQYIAEKEDQREAYEAFQELMNAVCIICFVNPKVVRENPGEGEIALHHIHQEDKLAVMNWANAPANSFRYLAQRQKGNLEIMDSGEELWGETEPASVDNE